MAEEVPVTVEWNLRVTTNSEVPKDVWNQGQEQVQQYVLEQCDMASATKTRVAGTFIVGEVTGHLRKEIGEVSERDGSA
ncbi:MAG: hypothetical protein WBR18_00605 [Anaerolineales bacterium]